MAFLRTKLSRDELFSVMLRSFEYYGKPYDYNFDFATEDSLVCSELVYKSFRDFRELNIIPGTVNGRLMFTPNDYAEKFDKEYGSANQELSLVLFLDGSEKNKEAKEGTMEEFRTSWQRPKWHVLKEYIEG